MKDTTPNLKYPLSPIYTLSFDDNDNNDSIYPIIETIIIGMISWWIVKK